jgi:hypothetical protein
LHNNIGWILCRLGRCAEAAAAYQRVVDSGDASLRAHGEAGLGRVAYTMGRTEEARTRLEAALALTHTLETPAADVVAEIEWHLSEVRMAVGDQPADILPLVERSLAFYRESGADEFAVRELIGLRRALRDK